MKSLIVFVLAAITGAFPVPSGTAQSSHSVNKAASKAAQAKGGTGPTSSDSNDGPPAYVLEFRAGPAIPRLTASPVISLPILCSPDGTPYIGVPEPPMYSERTIHSLDPKEPQSFSYKGIQGFYDIRFLSFFPGHSSVYILVNATQDSKQSQYTVTSPKGPTPKTETGFRGERHDFIMKFDKSGTFKTAIQLPDQLAFHRIAELTDKNFVAVAYDRANGVARLTLLGSDGAILRYLPLPEALELSSELKTGTTADALNRGRAESSLSWWLFAPARNNVLLYMGRSRAPVVEIGAGGAVREVPVSSPRGYSLSGMISSNDRWLFRYARTTLPDRGPVDTRPEARNYLLYEVDPNDGSLLRELDDSSGPSFGIACEQDGLLTGFSVSPESRYIPYTANLPR